MPKQTNGNVDPTAIMSSLVARLEESCGKYASASEGAMEKFRESQELLKPSSSKALALMNTTKNIQACIGELTVVQGHYLTTQMATKAMASVTQPQDADGDDHGGNNNDNNNGYGGALTVSQVCSSEATLNAVTSSLASIRSSKLFFETRGSSYQGASKVLQSLKAKEEEAVRVVAWWIKLCANEIDLAAATKRGGRLTVGTVIYRKMASLPPDADVFAKKLLSSFLPSDVGFSAGDKRFIDIGYGCDMEGCRASGSGDDGVDAWVGARKARYWTDGKTEGLGGRAKVIAVVDAVERAYEILNYEL